MKPIQTFYKGYKFRSRLEARYAVLFDSLGIKWEYEFEGFILPDATCYLPDFLLPTFNGGMYVEVKPKELTEEEKEKCYQLCLGSKMGVWLAVGTPDFRCWEVYYLDEQNQRVMKGDGIPNAGKAERENRMFAMAALGKSGEMINLDYRDKMGETFIKAVKAAKEARFEHGETPN